MSNVLINNYGRAVAASRAARGLTVTGFAKKLNVTHPVVSRIENGLRPSEDMAEKITQFLGFDPASPEIQDLVAKLAGTE